MQIDRIVAILVALVVGYFTLQFTDGIHHLTAEDLAKPKGQHTGWVVFAVIFGVVAAIVFGILFGAALDMADERVGCIVVSAALCFYFGLFVGPVTTWGPYPWHWFQSKWALLLVLALLPSLYLIVEFGKEFSRQRQKRQQADVVQFDRTKTK